MRSFAVVLLLGALAQAQNATYLAGLVQAATGAGLTSFITAVSSVNGTDVGKRLLGSIDKAGPLTIFVPNNDAFGQVPQSVSGNNNLLANILAYHVLPGNYTNATATAPNVTTAHTLLNDTSLVALEGNKSQVVAFNKDSSNTLHVLNQASDVTVSTVIPYQNLELKVINAVLSPPGNITTVLGSSGLSSLGTLASSIPGVVETLATAKGYTLFAPTNDALTAAAPSLAGLAGNNTALTAVIGNHIINGSTVYSMDIKPSSTFTSAAGQKISFVSNSTGLFVVTGDNVASAQIVKTDILVDRGVVHTINGVLANTASNAAAASSAFASATSVAAKPSQTNGSAGGQPSGSGASQSSSASGRVSLMGTGGVVAGVVGIVGTLMGGFLVL